MKKIWGSLKRIAQFFRAEPRRSSSEFENESARARMHSQF